MNRTTFTFLENRLARFIDHKTFTNVNFQATLSSKELQTGCNHKHKVNNKKTYNFLTQ
jgi:hypothetical protein